MFGTKKVKYHISADLALNMFRDYQRSVLKATGDLVVITEVTMDSDRDTIIRYKTVKPQNGPEKELSEAWKHINNAKMMLGGS